MSKEARLVIALFAGVMGLGLVAFGILRGATASGPGSGIRMLVAIAPPLDAPAVAMAEKVARDRVEEKGASTRVVPAGDHLLVEIGDADPEIVKMLAELLERTGKVELRIGEVSVVDARAIARVYIDETGVELVGRAPDTFARLHSGDKLDIWLDGNLRMIAPVDRTGGGELHLVAGGFGSDDAAFALADRLRSILMVGAVHPLHVTHEEPFTRATGFVPRAWPFAVPGLILIALALVLGVPRRAKPGK